MSPTNLRRLMAIDAALANDGMLRSELAAAWGCDKKTIQRDHDLLREVAGDSCKMAEDGTWYYRDRRNRLFRTRGERVSGGPQPPPVLAEVLRSARERAKMSQTQLARKSGVSLDTISKIECGVNERSRPLTLYKLAKILKIPHQELMQTRKR